MWAGPQYCGGEWFPLYLLYLNVTCHVSMLDTLEQHYTIAGVCGLVGIVGATTAGAMQLSGPWFIVPT